MAEGARHMVVGRFRRPHGLKGECTIFPLTDDPARVFAAGQELWTVDIAGEVIGSPLRVARSRVYHREWLLKFDGVDDRAGLERYRDGFLAVPAGQAAPLADDEVYLHELNGFAVRLEDGTAVGLVTDYYETAGGLVVEVQGPKREFLLPYRKEFVVRVDRDARRLVIAPPDGLLDG
ncbi:MAG TPA: ribosome maturation factor RimM [Gemmatimonadales bacterium]|nr:ribosome maturation factor RimM [Gemmatimonadales bacterium]